MSDTVEMQSIPMSAKALGHKEKGSLSEKKHLNEPAVRRAGSNLHIKYSLSHYT